MAPPELTTLPERPAAPAGASQHQAGAAPCPAFTLLHGSAAYRVRALALRAWPTKPSRGYLIKDGGQQNASSYPQRQPRKAGAGIYNHRGRPVLAQSLAIMEYLDEGTPQPALPADALGRARVRALAQMVACGSIPLNNLRVPQYLTQELGVSGAQRTPGYARWVALGLQAVEDSLARSRTPAASPWRHPGLADCCLVTPGVQRQALASALRARCLSTIHAHRRCLRATAGNFKSRAKPVGRQ